MKFVSSTWLALTPRLKLGLETSWFLWLVVVVLSTIKMRAYIPDGRFWAEEGKYFYGEISSRDGLSGLFYLFNSHLEFMTNLVVWLSTLVDFETAPRVTTLLSWVLQLLPIALVIHYRDLLKLSFPRTLFFVFAVSAIPQSAEVWANSINLHFHFALLTGIIAILPVISPGQAWLFRGLLLLAGLSGIPANALFPVLALIAFQTKSREKWVQTGILGMTALVQLAILISHGFSGSERSLATDPRLFWFVLVAQHFVSPLLGKALGRKLIEPMQDTATSNFASDEWSGWIVAAIATALYGVLIYSILRSRNKMAFYSVLAGLWLAAFCLLVSVGDRSTFISTFVGGRYFFASNLLLVLGILLHIPQLSQRAAMAIVAIWFLALAPGVKSYLGGKPWREALQESGRAQSETVETWPKGWAVRRPAT